MSGHSVAGETVQAMAVASTRYYRLVLLVGPSGVGKTGVLRRIQREAGAEYVNMNLKLSKQLLGLSARQRTLHARRAAYEVVSTARPDAALLLDNIEILFDPRLKLNPLRLLQELSRDRTVVAAWNGTISDGLLTYAAPDHPEYQSYRDVDAVTVQAGRASSNG